MSLRVFALALAVVAAVVATACGSAPQYQGGGRLLQPPDSDGGFSLSPVEAGEPAPADDAGADGADDADDGAAGDAASDGPVSVLPAEADVISVVPTTPVVGGDG